MDAPLRLPYLDTVAFGLGAELHARLLDRVIVIDRLEIGGLDDMTFLIKAIGAIMQVCSLPTKFLPQDRRNHVTSL